MATAPRDHDTFNWILAHQAWLAFASVDAVLKLEESFVAIGINVVGNARASQTYRLIQNFLQCGMQAPQFVASERRGAAPGTDLRAKQSFVGIDIADAAEQLLV